MGPFSMVVMIILIVTIGRVLQTRYRALSEQKAGMPGDADALATAAEVRQLKERIAVLERVITDNHGSIGLDREIERLRDR